MHKYSHPYLGQLKFSSGALMLLVDVTALQVKLTCGKLNWMVWYWKAHMFLRKSLTAYNAYQSKKTSLDVKRTALELRNRFASSHTSGEEFRKKLYFIEGSQKHVVSVTLNGRSLKQPWLFLEPPGLQDKLSIWWRRALVKLVTKKLMVTLVELNDHMWRWEKSTEKQASLQHSTDLGFMAVWPNSILSSMKTKENT